MLRIVHPAPEGQGPRTPKGRRRRDMHSLTQDERRHLLAALQNLRRAYGTWACLADAMRVPVATLGSACQGSPGLALRAARAGGMSVEAVLTGVLSAAGRCEVCGSRLGHGAIRAQGGAS
jgi:hypothetical protein